MGWISRTIDTGVDGSHPDIAANLDKSLSRNFTVDVPYDASGGPSFGRGPFPFPARPAVPLPGASGSPSS